MAKRIFSLCLCCLLIVSCLAVPAHAIPVIPNVNVDLVDIFDWAVDAGYHFMAGIFAPFFDEVCPSSPGLQYRHSFVQKRTNVDGQVGLYYICEYCGKSAGEVGQEGYDEFTGSLPATGYNSAGRLIWQPVVADVIFDESTVNGNIPFSSVLSGGKGSYSFSILSSSNGFYVFYDTSFTNFGFELYFKPPIDGFYGRLESCMYTGSFVLKAGSIQSVYEDYTTGSFSHFFASSGSMHVSRGYSSLNPNFSGSSSGSLYWYFPFYEIIPDTALSGDQYNITTRPTTITGGNYGIVGDDGQLTVVTVNDTIVNETNNTYYNPATGKTETITNWSYNYIDRSYNVTLESGDTITVTYGDQNITIIEGGDTYIIYYIIDSGCSGDDDDDPANSDNPSVSDNPNGADHEHTWQETSRVEPTCTLPGKIDYICEYCDQTRVDVLPAAGHKWQQKQFVPTTYDDDGNLIQQGYTIYECSVCGEQYKDVTGTGPPGSSSDTVDDGGLIGFFNNLIKHLSDNLSGAVDLILSFFRKIPELFGGFLDFLSAMFPFLPDDIIFLLTFGMAAVVFVGIIKAVRR